jgi:bifunctional isochorismate lyase/aryl carrier protein
MTTMLDLATIRQDVAELLYLPADELDAAEDLLSAGLDSVRILVLVERWRAAGVEVTFAELAERATLDAWLALLAPRLPAGSADA